MIEARAFCGFSCEASEAKGADYPQSHGVVTGGSIACSALVAEKTKIEPIEMIGLHLRERSR